MRDFLGKIAAIGLDKFAHFFAGASIAYTVGNVTALRYGADGWGLVLCSVAGTVCAAVCGLVKEVADDRPDWNDLLATVLGGLVPPLMNTVGMVLHATGA